MYRRWFTKGTAVAQQQQSVVQLMLRLAVAVGLHLPRARVLSVSIVSGGVCEERCGSTLFGSIRRWIRSSMRISLRCRATKKPMRTRWRVNLRAVTVEKKRAGIKRGANKKMKREREEESYRWGDVKEKRKVSSGPSGGGIRSILFSLLALSLAPASLISSGFTGKRERMNLLRSWCGFERARAVADRLYVGLCVKPAIADVSPVQLAAHHKYKLIHICISLHSSIPFFFIWLSRLLIPWSFFFYLSWSKGPRGPIVSPDLA